MSSPTHAPRAALLALVLLPGLAAAQDCLRLVEAFGPASWGKGQHQAAFPSPAPGSAAARWFLTVERQGPATGRVKLNGQTRLRPEDLLGPRGELVRVEVPLQAHNALEIEVHGQGQLRVRVQGLVPAADLPLPAGRPVAELTLYQRAFQVRQPCGWETVMVPVPASDGLFTLRLARSAPPPVLGLLRWNGGFPLGPLPLRPGHAVAEGPVRVQALNALAVRLVGVRGARAQVTLSGFVVDEAPPEIAWTAPAPGATVTAADPLRVAFSDALSGLRPGSLRVLLDGSSDVTAAFQVSAGEATSTAGALGVLPAGTHTLVASVQDRACNASLATVSFLVGGAPDVTPPVITTPGDLVVEQTSPAGAIVQYTATAADDRDPTPVLVCVPAPGATFSPGPTTVTCTARDASGNQSQASFTVTVRDTIAPALPQPPDLVVEQTSPAGAVVIYGAPVASDAADPAPVVSCSPVSGATFAPGPTTVTCTARDASGNQSQVSFIVTVRDTVAPSLAPTPADGAAVGSAQVLLAADYADAGSGVLLTSLVATVDSQDVTAQLAIGPARAEATLALANGTHLLQVRLRDAAGNETSRSSSFVVAVADDRPVALELTIGPAAPRGALPDETPLLVLAPGEVRSIDGSGNDLARPDEGRAGSRLLRDLLAADYPDGISLPPGGGRPGARAISNGVHAQGGSVPNRRRSSDFLWVWGQFLDHDLSLTRAHTPAEDFSIPVPPGDPFFDPLGTGLAEIPLQRSRYDVTTAPRQHLNELTAWVDASMVYGSDAARAAALRANDGTGRLLTSAGDLLPRNTAQLDNAPTRFDPSFFVAGDIRANEHAELLAIHTLLLREHNRLCGLLQARFPAATDEELYQAARRIVSAEVQVITYREFLPALLGPDALGPYAGYDPDLRVGIENAFANAALRLGHTLLSPVLARIDAQGVTIPEGPLPLHEGFFTPDRLTEGGGLEPLLRGAARQPCQDLDALVVDGVRNFLFGPPGAGGLDLASLNVQRGRDHGLPGLNEARRQLGLVPYASFTDLTSDPALQQRLRSVYATVEDVDLWTGGLSEDDVPGSQLGPVFHTLLQRQFQLLRDGDRFFYRNQFSGAALQALERTRLVDLIRRNTSIGAELADDAFLAPLLPFVEHDLTVRAVTASGETARAFTGFVTTSASDGKAPLDGLVFELAPADQGRVTVPGVAFFRTLGPIVVSARTVPVDPGDPELQGALTVQVAASVPAPDQPLPALLAAGEALTISGLSFMGETVELVIDGAVVATTVAGADGSFTLTAVPAPGAHSVLIRARDPISGAVVSTAPVTVQVQPPATLALLVAPSAAALSVGRALQLGATERFATGAERDATALVAWESLAPATASVDAAGLVRALATGPVAIRATLVNQSGTFVAESALTVTVPILAESSPAPLEADVAVTRESILRFSAPVAAATVTSQAIHAVFGGQQLAARLHLSPDRRTVTLFYDPHLPASSRVRLTVEGSLLQDDLGNAIDADRDGQPGGAALVDFDTLSLTVGPPGTAVCGRVFASELAPVGTGSVDRPLQGVKISVEGAEDTLFAFTDELGGFRLEPAPAGRFFVLVDGRTATNPDLPPGTFYPPVGKAWESVAGFEVNLGDTHLPLVRPGTLQPVSLTQDTTLGFTADTLLDFPHLVGTEVTVPADALYADDGARGGRVGIAPVPPDRLPGTLPPDLDFPLVITVQTDGATNFDRPIAVRFPNLTGLAPGEKTALWSFNHDTGAWEIVGGMTVTADGRFVVTDPGVGILAPGWHSWARGVQVRGGPPGAGEEGEEDEPMHPGQECASDQGDAACVCKHPSDGSVILSNGEERLDRVDLAIPGRGGLSFVLARRYRSQLVYDGPLGKGWDYDFNEKLFKRENGDVTRVNGASHIATWVRQPDGSYRAPEGYFGVLKLREDGVYVLRERDGTQRLFHGNGRLFCWLDRFGNQMGFEHDECGDLDFVVDPYGRVIDFVFETVAGKRRLTRVRDFLGREVLYAYDQEGNLTSVRSPVVTGTSTGNDFPAGRVERYTYSSGHADPRLNGNLLTITAPEEGAGGPAWLTIEYGTEPSDPLTFDKVIARTEGGTNASGIAAGGRTTYAYAMVNQGVPPGDLSVPRGRATITDRNGNVLEYFVNERNAHILTRHYTRGLRAGEPAFYETRSEFDEDGQLTRRLFPEGNELRLVYDRSGPRSAVKNVLEVRRVAGPRGDGRGGPAEDLVTTYSYEPIYNQLLTVTDPRGNSPTFQPPLGANTPGRYTTRYFYDYQEHFDPIPQAVAFGLPLGTTPRGLGDLNDDGVVANSAGLLVRVEAPTVTLEPGSNEAALRGTPFQPIVTQIVWNAVGQRTRVVDPEGNVTSYLYHPDQDPDGDGVATESIYRVVTSDPRGYLAAVVVDAATSPRRPGTAPPPTQLATSYRYDPVGNVIAVTNPRGVTTRFEVNALNEVVSVTRGAEIAQAVGEGQLITGEAPFGYRTRRFYDANGRVTKVEVENKDGNTEGVGAFIETSTVYDILGDPLEVTQEVDAATRLVTRLRYDPNQNRVETVLPEGNRITTAFDERDLVLSTTRGAGDPQASTVSLDYDLNGNRVRATDAEDTDGVGGPEQSHLVLDGFDRLVELRDPLGDLARTSYDPASNVVETEALGHPAGAPAAPNVLHARARLRHDELGRVFRSDAALFLAGGFAPARPVVLSDQDGDGFVTSRLEYDALSRPTFVVEDDGEVSRTRWDGASRAVESEDAAGNRVQRAFDRNGNPVRVTSLEVSPEGLVPLEAYHTRYVYDQLDRLARATDNAGQTTRFAWDSRSNLVSRSDPQGALTADPLGLFPGQVNGPGNTCRWVFDGADRQVRSVCDLRLGGTGAGALDTTNPRNPDGQISLSYVFDLNSRLVGIVDDNGNRTSFAYDALDRRVSQTNADGEQHQTTYDRDHNVRTVTDPNGSVVSKAYDALNRLVECTVVRAAGVGGSTRQTFSYDGLSRLVRSTDDNGAPGAGGDQVCEWVFDSLGRALEERQNGAAVSSRYTGDGKRAQVVYPGGRTITRSFDAIDRIKTLADGGGQLAQSDWIGPGLRELRRVNGNGTRLTFLDDTGTADVGWDAVQRVIRLRCVLPDNVTAFVDREYAYNRASQRTLERRNDDAGLTDSYTYDSAYRVVASSFDQEGGPGAALRDLTQVSYRYDGVGNRREVSKETSAGPVVESYSVNVMNEYAAVGPAGAQVGRTHDANGNLTDDGSRLLVWDAFNRLVGVARKSDGAPVAAYFYLPDGRRSRKVVYSQSNPGVVEKETRFVWDGAQEVEEQSAAGVTEATYVWSPVYVDELVEYRREAAHPLGAGSFYAHQDARCDVVVVTNASGGVVEKRRYDDFGREEIRDAGGAVVAASPTGLEYGFQGRRRDAETGWIYFRARFYDPGVGRFLSRDPVWDAGNVGGWYSFAGNGPVSGRDPSGLQKEGVILYNASGAEYGLPKKVEGLNQQIKENKSGGPIEYKSQIPPKPEDFAKEIKGKKVVIFLAHGNPEEGIKTDNDWHFPGTDVRLTAEDVEAALKLLKDEEKPEAVLIVGCKQWDPSGGKSVGKSFKAGGIPLVVASSEQVNLERANTPGKSDNAGVGVDYVRQALDQLASGDAPETAASVAAEAARQTLQSYSDIKGRGVPEPLPDPDAQDGNR